MPLRPNIVTSEVIKCGRAIKVEWTPPPTAKSRISSVSGYELVLTSQSDDIDHTISLSCEVHSHEFDGLKVNEVYKVSLQAKNSDGFGLPAEEQITTTAGTAKKRTLDAVVFVCYYCSYCRCCSDILT